MRACFLGNRWIWRDFAFVSSLVICLFIYVLAFARYGFEQVLVKQQKMLIQAIAGFQASPCLYPPTPKHTKSPIESCGIQGTLSEGGVLEEEFQEVLEKVREC